MPGSTPRRPAGAVEIAEEFRDNLIIDRYDPAFASVRASRRKHLHGASLHDAVTWNVFRSLRQIGSRVWLPELFLAAVLADVARANATREDERHYAARALECLRARAMAGP